MDTVITEYKSIDEAGKVVALNRSTYQTRDSTDYYTIAEWASGFRMWAQKVAMYVLRKWGKQYYMKERVYTYEPIDDADVIASISKQIGKFADRRLEGSHLVVLIGHEKYDDLLCELRLSDLRFECFEKSSDPNKGAYQVRVCNVPVVAVPYMRGVLVVPRGVLNHLPTDK
jgi:hypothetical protein